jgi:exopolyphosphatase/guanosine-5'-triphosphate,3'-diphosphate pyrophosphatase
VRLGVLDVGSNTVHLLVVDAHRGGHPDPVDSVKTELRLAELLRSDGSLGPEGTQRLVACVRRAREAAEQHGAEALLTFATSAVRDARDGAVVLDAVRREAGVELAVLPGEDEARMTFLAVRRWFGWSAGRLLSLDIGGGSLELAAGRDEEPDVALSLPLGAGRVTREHLPGDPPTAETVEALKHRVRRALLERADELLTAGGHDRAVGSSKTFRSLARIAGAAPYGAGPLVPRTLSLGDLDAVVDRLRTMPVAQRAKLPGVSPGRAGQLLGGALVAQQAMRVLGVEQVSICPWALREGLVLRHLDVLSGA